MATASAGTDLQGIRDTLRDIRETAASRGYTTLAYLLDMAVLEAQHQAEAHRERAAAVPDAKPAA